MDSKQFVSKNLFQGGCLDAECCWLLGKYNASNQISSVHALKCFPSIFLENHWNFHRKIAYCLFWFWGGYNFCLEKLLEICFLLYWMLKKTFFFKYQNNPCWYNWKYWRGQTLLRFIVYSWHVLLYYLHENKIERHTVLNDVRVHSDGLYLTVIP